MKNSFFLLLFRPRFWSQRWLVTVVRRWFLTVAGMLLTIAGMAETLLDLRPQLATASQLSREESYVLDSAYAFNDLTIDATTQRFVGNPNRILNGFGRRRSVRDNRQAID